MRTGHPRSSGVAWAALPSEGANLRAFSDGDCSMRDMPVAVIAIPRRMDRYRALDAAANSAKGRRRTWLIWCLQHGLWLVWQDRAACRAPIDVDARLMVKSGDELLALQHARMPQRAVIADLGTLSKQRRYASRHAPRASIPDDWRRRPPWLELHVYCPWCHASRIVASMTLAGAIGSLVRLAFAAQGIATPANRARGGACRRFGHMTSCESAGR